MCQNKLAQDDAGERENKEKGKAVRERNERRKVWGGGFANAAKLKTSL